MKYFKIIKDNTFIGVATSNEFIKYQRKHKIILLCDIDEAQYIMCKEGIFRDDWMATEYPENKGKYEKATITEITEDEYDALNDVAPFELPEEPEQEQEPEQVYINPIDEITIDYLLDKKIKAMKNACEAAITNGFDVGNAHYSLTIQDQLNLITLSGMADAGLDEIPYHADNESCRYFTADEIKAIIAGATAHKTYHTTYFNSLKAYIQSLNDMADIAAVYYGMEIPDYYKSDVLKDLT